MDDVYAGLRGVFSCEIKPFKLSFRTSEVFESSNMFSNFNYTAEQVYWNSNTNNRPVNIKTRDDFTLVKKYIKFLSIVETMVFQVSCMLRISR